MKHRFQLQHISITIATLSKLLTLLKLCQGNENTCDLKHHNILLGVGIKNPVLPQCDANLKPSIDTWNSLPNLLLNENKTIVNTNQENLTFKDNKIDLDAIKNSLFSDECERLQFSDDKPFQQSILYSIADGRVGNQMCNFATQYALNKEFGVLNYFKYKRIKYLLDTFNLPQPNKSNSTFHVWNYLCANPIEIEKEGKWIFLNHSILTDSNLRKKYFEEIKYSKYIKLKYECPTKRCSTYYCDIKGFYPHLKDLRRQIFRFKPNDMKQAKAIEMRLRSRKKKTILISIHIRLGDVMEKYLTLWNTSLATETYFQNAIKYFKQKYGKKVLFFVLSDEIRLARKIFEKIPHNPSDVIFPSFADLPVDHLVGENLVYTPEMLQASRVSLALLSLSDHSILTYSTFGLWGALLKKTKGEIILPKDVAKTDIGFSVLNANITEVKFI